MPRLNQLQMLVEQGIRDYQKYLLDPDSGIASSALSLTVNIIASQSFVYTRAADLIYAAVMLDQFSYDYKPVSLEPSAQAAQ